MSGRKRKSSTKGRATARLAAVQALYQQEMDGTPLARLLDEFHQHRIGKTIEDVEYADADIVFFDDIVRGVGARREEIDALIEGTLSGEWTLARLDRPLRQIARAGTYELLARIDVPAKVVISEYVSVADAFYDRTETGFINGVLNALAERVRG